MRRNLLLTLLCLALTCISQAANVYVRVTSADHLIEGMKYIFVQESRRVYMGPIFNNVGAAVDGPIADHKMETYVNETSEWTPTYASGDMFFLKNTR